MLKKVGGLYVTFTNSFKLWTWFLSTYKKMKKEKKKMRKKKRRWKQNRENREKLISFTTS